MYVLEGSIRLMVKLSKLFKFKKNYISAQILHKENNVVEVYAGHVRHQYGAYLAYCN